MYRRYLKEQENLRKMDLEQKKVKKSKKLKEKRDISTTMNEDLPENTENDRNASMLKKKDSTRRKKKKPFFSFFRCHRKRKFLQKRISSQSSPKSGGLFYKLISKYILRRNKTSGKVLETQNNEYQKSNELKLSSELYDLNKNKDLLPGTSKSVKQDKQSTSKKSDQKSKQAIKVEISDTRDLKKNPETDISEIEKDIIKIPPAKQIITINDVQMKNTNSENEKPVKIDKQLSPKMQKKKTPKKNEGKKTKTITFSPSTEEISQPSSKPMLTSSESNSQVCPMCLQNAAIIKSLYDKEICPDSGTLHVSINNYYSGKLQKQMQSTKKYRTVQTSVRPRNSNVATMTD